MPKYRLELLGAEEFEKLSQSLVQRIIGSGAKVYGLGKDGGREATFEGRAPYPSTSNQWDGNWIFQAKFHDVQQLGQQEARRLILRDLKTELEKIVKYEHPCDNYILITNVSLTPVYQTGLRDKIDKEIIPLFNNKIKNIHVWGGDDICRHLDYYNDIRTSYLHFLVPGDIIAQLVGFLKEKENDLTEMVKLYSIAGFSREQYAVLRDAGDIEDEEIPLKEVFIDLNVTFPQLPSSADELQKYPFWLREASSDTDRMSALSYLLDDSVLNLVLIGGPGEGKSTLGQYVAQIYRSRLIGKLNEMGEDAHKFDQCVTRIPFRILLRDYGQWISRKVEENTLYHYIAKDFANKAGREFVASQIHEIVKSNPIILILDGLDEVPDKNLRIQMLENIKDFVDQIRGVYKGDLRVVATTRPYGYTQEFSKQNFLHLTLQYLSSTKALDYVNKWITQREKDPTEANRIREVFNTCLTSDVVNVLTQTPLQVTILLFILRTRGTPPKQREELFEEYMKIIYQREQKNRPELLRTEPTIIYGLHQYIAYILHKQAAHDDTAALMDMGEFKERTIAYVEHSKQLETKEELEKTVNQIIEEARQRLVLIESPQENKIGFRLTSIREFFAASHMVDTSIDTVERDHRFKTITTNPYWRNVALFFAGRVGRNNPSSIASLIDVCRTVDTIHPDKFLKRGAELVMKMIEERAIREEHNQVGAIQYGLTAIDSSEMSNYMIELGLWGSDTQIDVLLNLPVKYKERIVRVFLKDRLEKSSQEDGLIFYSIYLYLFEFDETLKNFIKRASNSNSKKLKIFAMTKAIENKITESWVYSVIEELANTVNLNEVEYEITPYNFVNSNIFLQMLSERARKFILAIPFLVRPLMMRKDSDLFKTTITPKSDLDKLYLGAIKMLDVVHTSSYKTTKYGDYTMIIKPIIFSEDNRKTLTDNYQLIKNSLEYMSEIYPTLNSIKIVFELFMENHNAKLFEENFMSLSKNKQISIHARYLLGSLQKQDLLTYVSALDNVIKNSKDHEFASFIESVGEIIVENSKKVLNHTYKLSLWIMLNYDKIIEKYLDKEIVSKLNILLQDEDFKKIISDSVYMQQIEFLDFEVLEMLLDYMNNNPTKKTLFLPDSDIFLKKIDDTERLKDLTKKIVSKTIENPVGYSNYDLFELYRFALNCNILTAEHMKFFAKHLGDRSFFYFPPTLYEESIKFLKTMLENQDVEICTLAAISFSGTKDYIDDDKITKTILKMTESKDDHLLVSYINSLSRCKLNWKSDGTAYLGLISLSKNEAEQIRWSNLLNPDTVREGENESFLKCLYTILESPAVFSYKIRRIALDRLRKIINKIEPIDFDEKSLNLPLREIKISL